MKNQLIPLGKKAKESATILATLSSAQKDALLLWVADLLEQKTETILAANDLDLKEAVKNGLSPAMQDRLKLDASRISGIANAVRQIVSLADPIRVVLGGGTRPNGLEIVQKTVPLGVVAMIYEARPNVTIDSAVLCLKSGNACILRGGKEAFHSNAALVTILQEVLLKLGLPKYAVQLVEDTSRESATALMQLDGYVDALIPRGGRGLIESVVANASVPVIETGAGMCHLYVDDKADLSMALDVLYNAKTSRPSVCNSVETLLIHNDIAGEFLPMVADKLTDVSLKGCEETRSIIGELATLATKEDYSTEYNDYILNIKVMPTIRDAIKHIATYSTHHSEVIITESYSNAELFTSHVDSAAVYVNASSRFTDGGEFGLGAEIGISTQKMHVRGPMGLMALTSSKYIIRGNGQVRQ